MKGATDDGMIARYGYNVKVSTRAPVKGATDTPRHDRIAVVMVSTRAPVKGATPTMASHMDGVTEFQLALP